MPNETPTGDMVRCLNCDWTGEVPRSDDADICPQCGAEGTCADHYPEGAPPDLPPACECDNTHQQNDTVCRWCWAHGRRKWNDPDTTTTTLDPRD